jgi:hypothetical protein
MQFVLSLTATGLAALGLEMKGYANEEESAKRRKTPS